MIVTILPPNSTATELAIEGTSARIDSVPVPNALLWNVELCPAAFLPWLANALSVDDWDADWTEEIKREVIRQSISVHRRKGTIGSLRTALLAADLGAVQVIERFGWHDYDGRYLYDGTIGHEARDSWAEYRIKVANPLSAAQAAKVQAILKSTTPARCHLAAVDYFSVAFTYSGAIVHDGTYKYGEP